MNKYDERCLFLFIIGFILYCQNGFRTLVITWILSRHEQCGKPWHIINLIVIGMNKYLFAYCLSIG